MTQPSWCIRTRRSESAISPPPSYSHTCPHLKRAAGTDWHTHKHTGTHTHETMSPLGLEPLFKATPYIWLFQIQKLWKVNYGMSDRKGSGTHCWSATLTCWKSCCFISCHVFMFYDSLSLSWIVYNHVQFVFMVCTHVAWWNVCVFVPLSCLLSCRGNFVPWNNSEFVNNTNQQTLTGVTCK